jgi:hypothetical protein
MAQGMRSRASGACLRASFALQPLLLAQAKAPRL